MKPSGTRTVTDFESSVNAVRAVSSFLKGSGHPAMGTGPSSTLLAKAAALPPRSVREKLYELAGRSDALPEKKVPTIDVDAIDRWVVGEYDDASPPHQTYPAVITGAVSGAAFFLAAALGVPFLPQTTLVSVRDGQTHPDDITGAMRRWAPPAREVAANNPRVSVYHMHDPAQDRPMMAQAAFFRLKRKVLGPVYEQFLRDRLDPGGVIVTLDSTRTWRSTQTGERSLFQFGCLGGLPEDEYSAGSTRISEFLKAQGSEYTAWEAPEPTNRTPDGEWGFDSALSQDVDRLAAEAGWRRRTLYQNEPQDASAFIAELYRHWYRRLGWADTRLLVQTYNHLDPWYTVATGSVPFWNRFHMQPSFEVLAEYLAAADSYDEVLISLFSHGLNSPGLVDVPEWEQLARDSARTRGEVIGVDRQAYPADTGAAFRYQEAFKELGPHRELPAPLTVEEVDTFAQQYGIEHAAASLPEHTDDVTGNGIRNPVAWAGT